MSSATRTWSAWRSRSSAARIVAQGRVDEGMALLDEAMTVALGGESNDPLACGDACCTTLVVCDGLADLRRAAAVVRGRRRLHRAAHLHARAVLVPRHLRRRARPRGRLGARGGGAPRRAAAGRRIAGEERPRVPLAVLAELRLRQGRTRRRRGCSTGLDQQRCRARPRSCSCSSSVKKLRQRRPCSERVDMSACERDGGTGETEIRLAVQRVSGFDVGDQGLGVPERFVPPSGLEGRVDQLAARPPGLAHVAVAVCGVALSRCASA